MSAVLGIILIIVVGPYLVSRIAHARNAAWAGPRSPGMRGRAVKAPASRSPGKAAAKAAKSAGRAVAHPGSRQIRAQARADAFTAWQQAFATDYLEGRRHARANGTAPAADTPAATRPTLRQRLRLAPFVAQPASPASGGADGTSPNGAGGRPAQGGRQRGSCLGCGASVPHWVSYCGACDPGDSKPGPDGNRPANGNGGPPARPAPPPTASTQPAPPSSNGGTNMAAGTSTASAEKLIEGINEIHAHAAAGGIHAKQEAIKAIHEGLVRFAAMLAMLSRQMSEPGQNYGHEITEPLAQAGTHCQAAAMSDSEADAALSTLINMTVGDLAASPRQAPHHGELSESGAR